MKLLLCFLSTFFFVNGVPLTEVVEGPSTRTRVEGPDGSVIEAFAPGGKIVTDGISTVVNQEGLAAKLAPPVEVEVPPVAILPIVETPIPVLVPTVQIPQDPKVLSDPNIKIDEANDSVEIVARDSDSNVEETKNSDQNDSVEIVAANSGDIAPEVKTASAESIETSETKTV